MKKYGEMNAAYYGSVVKQTVDKGYIITGRTGYDYNTRGDTVLIKTNAVGDEIWRKTFIEGDDKIAPYDVIQASDGGYVILEYIQYGYFGSGYWGNSDTYVIKTDSNGNEVWSNAYGGNEWTISYTIAETKDGGFVMAGENREDTFYPGIYLLKIDSNGNEVWSKTFYGNNKSAYGYFVRQTSDEGYVVGSQINNKELGNSYDAHILKTDSEGNKIWTNTFGGVHGETSVFTDQTIDGGYILIGDANCWWDSVNNKQYADVFLLKMDSNGNDIWSKTFQNFRVSRALITKDDGYALLGWNLNTNKFNLITYYE